MNENERDVVLIVDDNPTNLGVLFEYLHNTDFKVLVAEDGRGALEGVSHYTPDIILLDIMMPGLDGFETCRRLKANEATKDIPVIFMTALSDTTNKVQGFKVGAVDYVTKPFQYEELLARINTHLTLRKLQKQLQEQNEKLQKEVEERQRAEAELQRANRELYRLSVLDELTQLANRRRFDQYLQEIWLELKQARSPLSLIFSDIDRFKEYNDAYGHQAGDHCLHQIGKAIRRAVRRPDELAARYGGEEFAILLPDTELEEAVRVAQCMQNQVAQLAIQHAPTAQQKYVTLSLGVTSAVPGPQFSPDLFIAMADKALYKAKAQGRDQIVVKTNIEMAISE